MIDEKPIRIRFNAVGSTLDERGRRLHAAAEAVSAGHGGVAAGARATKGARGTIGRGLKDLCEPAPLTGRGKGHGAGREKPAGQGATPVGGFGGPARTGA